MARLMLANDPVALRRRVYFHVVLGSNGIDPALEEGGGQPQISLDGGAWTEAGIETLSPIGQGRYYAEITPSVINTVGRIIETRYKSGNTAEVPGDTVMVVGFNPYLPNLGIPELDVTVGSRASSAGLVGAIEVLNESITAATQNLALQATTQHTANLLDDLTEIHESYKRFRERALALAPTGGGGTGELPEDLLETMVRLMTRLNQIGGGIVRVITPHVQDDEVEIVRGDDYLVTIDRGIGFESDAWPNLHEATVVMSAVATTSGRVFAHQLPVQVLKAAADEAGPAVIAIEMDHQVSELLPLGQRSCRFDVQATLKDGQRVTLVRSHFNVVEGITR